MNVVNNTRADVIARGVLRGLAEMGLAATEILGVFRVPGSWETEALRNAGVRVASSFDELCDVVD